MPRHGCSGVGGSILTVHTELNLELAEKGGLFLLTGAPSGASRSTTLGTRATWKVNYKACHNSGSLLRKMLAKGWQVTERSACLFILVLQREYSLLGPVTFAGRFPSLSANSLGSRAISVYTPTIKIWTLCARKIQTCISRIVRTWGFTKMRGTFLKGPYDKDKINWGVFIRVSERIFTASVLLLPYSDTKRTEQ